jgi:ABC-type multidrug transport system fused ATPase/permease subunit
MAGSSVPPTAAPSRTASSANLLGQSNTAPGSPTSSSAPTLVEKRQQIRSLGASHPRTQLRSDTRGADQPVSEMGNNFSSGQRQLLALARCLLRRPKILLMDEASSSIDKATDTLIQQFIRDAFADAMVITASRSSTSGSI